MLTKITHELKNCVTSISKGCGTMTTSIYDTALVLAFGPPIGDRQEVINWLLANQEPDGGWEKIDIILSRLIASMAAIYALNLQVKRGNNNIKITTAVTRGVKFAKEAFVRYKIIPHTHFVASELIIPYLISLLEESGINLDLDFSCLSDLYSKRDKKFQMMEQLQIQSATAITHAWETWPKKETSLYLQDNTGGVGHSPAATAVWYHLATKAGLPQYRLDHAKIYLQNATNAMASSIEGIFSCAWPTYLMDKSFALHPLILSGSIMQPYWQKIIQPYLKDIFLSLQQNSVGIGMSNIFEPDGDTTAVALLLLVLGDSSLLDQRTLQNCLDHFISNDRYGLAKTYQIELDCSLGVNAKFCHLLRALKLPNQKIEKYIISLQQPDGLWANDKWNMSKNYATMCAVYALNPAIHDKVLQKVTNGLIECQNPNGSWSFCDNPSIPETAYACLALSRIFESGMGTDVLHNSLKNAAQYLLEEYKHPSHSECRAWIEKVLYTYQHWDKIFHLATLISLLEKGIISNEAQDTQCETVDIL